MAMPSQGLEQSMRLKPGEVATGTTIMAVEFDGGVVLGADSRTSTGTYVANRVSDKLTALHHHIYCCRSGSAADTQALSDYVRYFLASHSIDLGRAPAVSTAAKLMSTMIYRNKDNLMAGVIIGGWDPKDGGQVYTVTLGGTLQRQKFSIGGSGSTYIYGHVDEAFKEQMTREECQAFVKKAISHAMARDGSSGGVIRMVTIDKSGVAREFIPGDKLPYGP
ncbi:proteasome subunit beta type- [Nannochloropsis oceanica]